MNEDLRGLRLITNLHCNQKCNFCYQERKTKDILQLDNLRKELLPYSDKHFLYCTIMGGESTLLPDLPEYIRLGAKYSQEVRLTTNGVLLDEKLLNEYKEAGLTGINISIASLEHYKEITGGSVSREQIMEKTLQAREVFPNLRVNVALCKENMQGEIKDLVAYFVDNLNLNITICESMSAHYSCLSDAAQMLDSQVVEDTGYGLVFLEHKGKQFGYYSHKDNYKHTDLVITPLGTWTNWDGYCEAVGIAEHV